jgi:hypothetical protein
MLSARLARRLKEKELENTHPELLMLLTQDLIELREKRLHITNSSSFSNLSSSSITRETNNYELIEIEKILSSYGWKSPDKQKGKIN